MSHYSRVDNIKSNRDKKIKYNSYNCPNDNININININNIVNTNSTNSGGGGGGGGDGNTAIYAFPRRLNFIGPGSILSYVRMVVNEIGASSRRGVITLPVGSYTFFFGIKELRFVNQVSFNVYQMGLPPVPMLLQPSPVRLESNNKSGLYSITVTGMENNSIYVQSNDEINYSIIDDDEDNPSTITIMKMG